MKLVIEIGDYEDNGELHHFFMPKIEPLERSEGISVYNKTSQTEKFARLIDLSKALEDEAKRFYEKYFSSASSVSRNTSSDPSTM